MDSVLKKFTDVSVLPIILFSTLFHWSFLSYILLIYIYILFPLLLRHTIKTSIRMRCRATISAAMKTSTCSIARKLRDSRARQVNSLFPLLYLLFYCAKSQSLIWFLLLAFFLPHSKITKLSMKTSRRDASSLKPSRPNTKSTRSLRSVKMWAIPPSLWLASSSHRVNNIENIKKNEE